MVLRVFKDLRVHLDIQDFQDHKGHLDPEDHPDRPVVYSTLIA